MVLGKIIFLIDEVYKRVCFIPRIFVVLSYLMSFARKIIYIVSPLLRFIFFLLFLILVNLIRKHWFLILPKEIITTSKKCIFHHIFIPSSSTSNLNKAFFIRLFLHHWLVGLFLHSFINSFVFCCCFFYFLFIC